MTDRIFYEELRATIRDAIASYLDTYTDEELRELATESLKLQQRPTLADMTPAERESCRWMQADTEARGRAIIIVAEWGAGHAELLDRWGNSFYAAHDTITPRPDLPRFVWPGDTPETPAPAPALPEGWRLADHPDRGRVIVTTENPDRHGYVAFTYRANYLNSGSGSDWCKHDVLTFLDTPAAPPPNTLTVGSVWVGVNALTRACEESGRDQIAVSDCDGYVSVWDNDAEWWEGSVPPRAAPYTIIYAGREADQ